MFPLVSVWVRQQGAWKLHPYNFIAQNCLLLPFWLHQKTLKPGNCYCHTWFHNNNTQKLHMDILVLTAALPCYHRISPHNFLHLTHSSLQQTTQTLLYKLHYARGIFFFWIQTTCPMKFSNSYLTSLCFTFLIFICPSTSQGPHFHFSVQVFTLYYFQIASELSQVLTSLSSCGVMNLLHSKLSLQCLWLHLPHADWLLHFFQVSHDPFSGNDTGCHAVQISITLNSWFLDTRKM